MTNQDRALRSAQTMHDRATDDRPDDFIDTLEGQAWLDDRSGLLAAGEDVIWTRNGRVNGITTQRLASVIMEECSEEWQEASRLFTIASLTQNPDDEQAMAISQSEVRKVAKEVAWRLLAPLADDYLEWEREQEFDL